jgi:Uma2 family endonuclease
MTIISAVNPDLLYPESDGKPMAENTEQYRWIVMIKENLEILFANDLEIFIAGDLLWYPVEGDNKTCQAPDVMVIVGRPKGKRRSYQQWKEHNIAPQVAFEIMSPSNQATEMVAKREFYERYGVEEYYVYDPDRLRLTGWLRRGQALLAIAAMEGWVSPQLGIRFTQQNGDLEIYRPDGRRFLSSVELERRAEQALQQAEEAQAQAEEAQAQAEQASQQAAAERAQRLAAEKKAQRLAEHLRSLGIDPDRV